METNRVLDELICRATRELLQGVGLDFQPTSCAGVVMERAAVIGFTGRDLRGVLGIGMTDCTLNALAAKANAAPHREDWLGEAANQLIGRFKNKLLRYGTTVSIALPMVLRGVRIQFMTPAAPGVSTHRFASSSGDVCVWLDVHARVGFEPRIAPTENVEGVAREGDLLLF